MKELLLYMAKSLVDDPERVEVREIEGRIAREIRTIVKSVAQRTGQKVTVEIVD